MGVVCTPWWDGRCDRGCSMARILIPGVGQECVQLCVYYRSLRLYAVGYPMSIRSFILSHRGEQRFLARNAHQLSHFWDPEAGECVTPMGLCRSEPYALFTTDQTDDASVRHGAAGCWVYPGACIAGKEERLLHYPTHPGGMVGYPPSLHHPLHCWTCLPCSSGCIFLTFLS